MLAAGKGCALASLPSSKDIHTMRTLILLGFLVGGLVVAGAIHITQTNGNIEVSIDKQRVKNVAGAVVSEGEKLLRNAANQGDQQRK